MSSAEGFAPKVLHSIRLNATFLADVELWHEFCAIVGWGINDVGEVLKITCAMWGDRWFQLEWSHYPDLVGACIAVKELFPIVVAAAAWGE